MSSLPAKGGREDFRIYEQKTKEHHKVFPFIFLWPAPKKKAK